MIWTVNTHDLNLYTILSFIEWFSLVQTDILNYSWKNGKHKIMKENNGDENFYSNNSNNTK